VPSIRQQWNRLTRPEQRYRAEVTAQHADGTSTVQTSDGRITRVRNQPGLNVPVGSFCIVSTGRRPGELPVILRTAPSLVESQFHDL
jgi:hypothetical protein